MIITYYVTFLLCGACKFSCVSLENTSTILMAFPLNTDQIGGESEGSSPSNQPTLKEFISKELKQIPDLYTKLTTEIDITELDDLIFLDDNDKNEICTALSLSL
eukprot:350254_1